MNSAPESAARIVVALDAPPLDDLAIEIAREVASVPSFELLGLFVEDQWLLEHAKSPLAREIVMSGLERPLDASRLERQLRAQATQVRGLFEAAAARAGIRHGFQVTRGELVEELLRAAANAEAIVVALTRSERRRGVSLGALARAGLRALLFARESWLTGRSILAVVEASGESRESLRVAARLAERTRSQLYLLPTAEARADTSALTQIEELRARGVVLHLLAPSAQLTADVIARSARDARLLVVPSRGAQEEQDLVEQLLEKTRTALLLIRD
jgi:hypothetical protein